MGRPWLSVPPISEFLLTMGLNCLRYFDFHPAPEWGASSTSPKTHGLICVWGFGTFAKSSHSKIQVGEHVYAYKYFSPTRYLLVPISPSDVNKISFCISRPHLPADRRSHNQIIRCVADPHYILGLKIS